MSFSSLVFAQLLFPEMTGWGKEQDVMLPEDLNLTYEINADSLAKGDTVNMKIFYPNKQIAIEGPCLIKGDDLNFSKVKTWNYYYQNGKLWSTRSYTARSGKLKSVDKLLDPSGKDLSLGYGRFIGKYHMYSGFGLIYNEKAEVEKIAQYTAGLILDTYSPETYSSEQLQRLNIREFITSDSISFEELSIEEAFELQKTEDKTILLNVSTSWNGYTKRGYEKLYSDPKIAKLLYDNFIIAYLDLEDPKDIRITLDGLVKEFKGKVGTGNPEFINTINGAFITSTPTYLFINSSFELEHRHTGMEIKDGMFEKMLDFYLTEEYQVMSWKEYKER